jgi:hypothetical protein
MGQGAVGRLPRLKQDQCHEEHESADQHKLYAVVHHVWNPTGVLGRSPTHQDVASKACQRPAIRYDQRPLGSHLKAGKSARQTDADLMFILLYNTCTLACLQEMLR